MKRKCRYPPIVLRPDGLNKDVSKCIWVIAYESYNKKREHMYGNATGVAITDKYILSCAHGIVDAIEGSIEARRVYEKGGVWYGLVIVHMRLDWDLSLLEFKDERPKGRLDFLSISEDETLSPFDVLFLEGNPYGNFGSFFKLTVVFPCKKISFSSFRQCLTCEEHSVDRSRGGGTRHRTMGDIFRKEHLDKQKVNNEEEEVDNDDDDVPITREEHGDVGHLTMEGDIFRKEEHGFDDDDDEHFDEDETYGSDQDEHFDKDDTYGYEEEEDNDDVPMTREEQGDERGRRHRTMGDIYNEETIPLCSDDDEEEEEDNSLGPNRNRNVPIIICSGISSSGASGGPFLTENGDVIGIHVIGNSKGAVVAIHASALNAFLAEATVTIPLGVPMFEKLEVDLIDAAVFENKPPLNFFRQAPDGLNLICKLTGDIIQKSEEHISKHINGRKFLDKLADDAGVRVTKRRLSKRMDPRGRERKRRRKGPNLKEKRR